MSRGLLRNDVTDAEGNAVQGALVTVYVAGTLTKATLYSESVGGVIIANPLTTDVKGVFQSFVETGEYDLAVVTAAGTENVYNIPVLDADDVASIEANLATSQQQIDDLTAISKAFVRTPEQTISAQTVVSVPEITDQTADITTVFLNGSAFRSGYSISAGQVTFDNPQSGDFWALIPFTNPIGSTTASAVTDTSRGQSVQETLLETSLSDITSIIGKVGAFDGQRVSIASYHPGWAAVASNPVGGGEFVWQATRPKSDHNGGTVISPSVPWDGISGASHADFLNGTGETDGAGFGCWARVTAAGKDRDIEEFGAQPGADIADILDAANASFEGFYGDIKLPANSYTLSRTVTLGNNYHGIKGQGYGVTSITATAAMSAMIVGGVGDAVSAHRMIKGVTFNGDLLADATLDMREDRYCTIELNRFTDFKNTGLIISKWAMRVKNNHFAGYSPSYDNAAVTFANTCILADETISTGNGALNDVLISENTFQRCGVGVQIRGKRVNVWANEFDVCNTAGIVSVSTASIKGNYFERCGVSANASEIANTEVPYYKAGLNIRGPIVIKEVGSSTTSYVAQDVEITDNIIQINSGVAAISLSNVGSGVIKNNFCRSYGATSRALVRLFGEGTGFVNRSGRLEISGRINEFGSAPKPTFVELVEANDADFNDPKARQQGYLGGLVIDVIDETNMPARVLINDLTALVDPARIATTDTDITGTKWTITATGEGGINAKSLDIELAKMPGLAGTYVYCHLKAAYMGSDGYGVMRLKTRHDTVNQTTYEHTFGTGAAREWRTMLFRVPDDLSHWGLQLEWSDDDFDIEHFAIYSASIDPTKQIVRKVA